jgi:PAS domain S-box-containing protein
VKKTLLLVDDEPIIAAAAAEQLKNMGYSVLTAYSGEKAAGLFESGPHAVDLVLMDIDLQKGLNGIETAERILSVQDVPIIFLSSHTEEKFVRQTEQVSSYGYVVKSSGVFVLEAAIKRAFALREKEQALRKSEARFRSYFDLPHVGLSITSPEKNWLEVNDKLCSMLGYSREEIVTKTWADLTHPEDLPADEEVFGRLLAGEIDFYTLDKRYIRKDGGIVWASIAVSGVRSGGGNIDHVVATIQDISQRKKLEEDLRKSAGQKEILMREMQHRIKNNLAIISSLFSLEMQDLDDNGMSDIFLRAISRINSMSAVYDKLKHLKEFNRIDLVQYIRDLADSLVTTYQRDTVRIRYNCEMETLIIDSQKAVLFGIIINELVTNAVKHAYPHHEGGEVRIALWRSGKELHLQVADRGRGLPEKGEHGSGGGLGLNLVKVLTEQLEGEIVLESGEGAAVTISVGAETLSN